MRTLCVAVSARFSTFVKPCDLLELKIGEKTIGWTAWGTPWWAGVEATNTVRILAYPKRGQAIGMQMPPTRPSTILRLGFQGTGIRAKIGAESELYTSGLGKYRRNGIRSCRVVLSVSDQCVGGR